MADAPNRQVRQTQNVDVRVNVCVAFHPAGTNTPQSQCEIFCLLNFKEVNKGSLILNINKQANILQFLKEYCVLFLILNGVLVCSVSCRVRLYIYIYAYVYVSCLPNLPSVHPTRSLLTAHLS